MKAFMSEKRNRVREYFAYDNEGAMSAMACAEAKRILAETEDRNVPIRATWALFNNECRILAEAIENFLKD